MQKLNRFLLKLGKTRSKQQSLRDGAFSSDEEKQFGTDVLNVQVKKKLFFSFVWNMRFSFIKTHSDFPVISCTGMRLLPDKESTKRCS